MARFPRVVVVDVPHHVTQRGNARQVILASDSDRLTYLALLRENAQVYDLSLLGYCLMSNHVHLIAVPHCPTALSHSLKQAHGTDDRGQMIGTDDPTALSHSLKQAHGTDDRGQMIGTDDRGQMIGTDDRGQTELTPLLRPTLGICTAESLLLSAVTFVLSATFVLWLGSRV